MEGRFKAAIESNRWVYRALDNDPEVKEVESWVHLYARDYAAAREARQISDPGFFKAEIDPALLTENVEDACVIGYIMTRTGEERTGRKLIKDATTHFNEVLSQNVKDTGKDEDLVYCLAAMGEFEMALTHLEKRWSQGRLDFWWEPQLLEFFDPLRGDPRFETAIAGVEVEMARQRDSLRRLEAEGL